MITRNFLILVFLITTLYSYGISQSDITIGSWKSYLPNQIGKRVTQSQEKIIYATDWSLILIDKEDLSTEFMGKVEGLSDIGIQNVTYDHYNNQVLVIYTNSNLDILTPGNIINLPNIKTNNNISGDKQVSMTYFLNDHRAFLATGFGIVELNTQTYNFGSTTFTGIRVTDITSHNGFLYGATPEGAYRVIISDNINLGDFNQWENLGSKYGLPSLYEARALVTHNGFIYIGTENTLYKSDDGEEFIPIIEFENPVFQTRFLESSNDWVIWGLRDAASRSAVLFINDDDEPFLQGQNCSDRVNFAIQDEQGRVWYADDWNEIRYSEGPELDCKRMSYNSPYSHDVSDIAIKDNLVLAASGGVSESFLYLFSRQGFYLLEDKTWFNFNEFVNSEIKSLDLLSVFRVAVHPEQPKIYAGSYWAGLLEMDLSKNTFLLFNKHTSSLRGAIGDEARERITGLAFDSEENLWVSTYGAPEPINVFTSSGEWRSFPVISRKELIDVVIDQNGFKWFPVFGNSGGVLIYDSGPSLQSTADDRQRFLNSSNSEMTSNNVNSILVDLDGAVWVGTSEGPVIFDCGSDIFDVSCTGIRRKVLQDSIAAFLLADQDIRSMAVDGANRKWFGTRHGIFVQSPDGQDAILHFTEKNSPLFDDHIQALAYNGQNGEMIIGTNKGILAYRTKSTSGARFHKKSEVFAFPNPVTPSYSGPIAIKGLVTDALVKITDINGNLIFETKALGGQAIWDGRDLSKTKVAAGVYLVFSNEENTFDRPDAFVTKIMLLR